MSMLESGLSLKMKFLKTGLRCNTIQVSLDPVSMKTRQAASSWNQTFQSVLLQIFSLKKCQETLHSNKFSALIVLSKKFGRLQLCLQLIMFSMDIMAHILCMVRRVQARLFLWACLIRLMHQHKVQSLTHSGLYSIPCMICKKSISSTTGKSTSHFFRFMWSKYLTYSIQVAEKICRSARNRVKFLLKTSLNARLIHFSKP